MFCGGEKMRKESCHLEDILPAREELLRKNREFLKEKINQERLFIMENSRKNRGVALQALRRKKRYETHLAYIDCAVKALRSAYEHIDIVNKVNDLIKDIVEEQESSEDMSDTLYTSVSFDVEFDEDELLAELGRLDEGFSVKNRSEERVPRPKVPLLSKMEEDEVENQLEYLQRWLNEPS